MTAMSSKCEAYLCNKIPISKRPAISEIEKVEASEFKVMNNLGEKE